MDVYLHDMEAMSWSPCVRDVLTELILLSVCNYKVNIISFMIQWSDFLILA